MAWFFRRASREKRPETTQCDSPSQSSKPAKQNEVEGSVTASLVSTNDGSTNRTTSSSTTTIHHSIHNLKPRLSMRCDRNTGNEDVAALKRAISLRRRLQPLRAKRSDAERFFEEEETRILKCLRSVELEGKPGCPSTLRLYKELAVETERFLGRRRDELGPFLEEIHLLERELDECENWVLLSQRSWHDSPAPGLTASAAAPTEAFPTTGRHAGEAETVLGAETWSGEPDPEEAGEDLDWDPSKYHPKYVELQDQIADVKLVEERVSYFISRRAKLQEQKDKRQRVKLRLLPADEEELQTLPSTILSLQLELEAEREKVEKLKDDCLLLGIANEDDSPVELLSAGDAEEEEYEEYPRTPPNTKYGQEETVEKIHVYEAWMIKAARRKQGRGNSSRSTWARSPLYQLSRAEESMVQSIEKLNRKRNITERYRNLTPAQRQRVDSLLEKKNSEESPKSSKWEIAQLYPRFKTIHLNSTTRKATRTVFAIMVFLRGEIGLETPAPPEISQQDRPQKWIDSSPSTAKYASANEPSTPVQRPAAMLAQVRALKSRTSPAASSGSSCPTNMADTINWHAQERRSTAASMASRKSTAVENRPGANWEAELTYVEYWIFGQLEANRNEVRLLAAILQAAGMALSYDTSSLVIKYWSSDATASENGRAWTAPNSWKDWKEAAREIKKEGYDGMLVRQVVGYSLRMDSREVEIVESEQEDLESLRGSG